MAVTRAKQDQPVLELLPNAPVILTLIGKTREDERENEFVSRMMDYLVEIMKLKLRVVPQTNKALSLSLKPKWKHLQKNTLFFVHLDKS